MVTHGMPLFLEPRLGCIYLWPRPRSAPTGRNGAGPRARNMVSTERDLPETFVPGEKDPQGRGIRPETTRHVLWTARLGSMACSTPVVADGRLFIGSCADKQGVFSCFDALTGKLLWRWTAPARDVPKKWDGRQFQFSNFPAYAGSLLLGSGRRRPGLLRQPAAGSPVPGRPRRGRRDARPRSCGRSICGSWACGRPMPATAPCSCSAISCTPAPPTASIATVRRIPTTSSARCPPRTPRC